MSEVDRRSAIFLHSSDVDKVTNVKSNRTQQRKDPKGLAPRRSKTADSSDPVKPRRRGTNAMDGRHGNLANEGRPTGPIHRLSISPEHAGGGRRESMQPETGGRRASTCGRRGSSFVGGGGRRGSRLDETGNRPGRKKKKAEEPSLTTEQVEAFQEVFDLFDSNGGGTIDADELQGALSSVDIHLPTQDIRDMLQGIDKDGSGEMDFEEFLSLMTNTEKFLEKVAETNDEHPAGEEDVARGRETILFDALTKFMKTSALKQMDVLERYFNTKYTRAQAPHVVMHYAAGARLIGLTEKQLVQHLDRLQESNEEYDYKSPYAKPLRITLAPKRKKKAKKKKTIVEPEEPEPDQAPRLTGKIRIRFNFKSNEGDSPLGEEKKKHEEVIVNNVVEADKEGGKAVNRPIRLGWVRPSVKSIASRLSRRLNLRSNYTMDNLTTIRNKIQKASNDFYHDLAVSQREDNHEYWKSLECHRMNTTQRSNFKRVFRTYIDPSRHVLV